MLRCENKDSLFIKKLIISLWIIKVIILNGVYFFLVILFLVFNYVVL